MDHNDHSVYLTFDDGPIPESTPFILQTLKEFGIHATFFMVGDNVRKYPELYKQIVADGHQVGNHTYHHLGGFKHLTSTYVKDTNRANELIGSHLFRPPHGCMSHAEYLWLRRKRYARNGSIITFHDSLKSIEKLHTALPRSLQWLKEQGYSFKVFD